MKRLVLSLGFLLATSAVGAHADLNYPWCAQYGGREGGARNCGFSTFSQCMATVSGIGGFCERNNTYVPSGPARHSARKRHYHYSDQY